MRREKKVYPEVHIKLLKPLVWKTCDCCGYEVRNEKIWRVNFYSPYWGSEWYEQTVSLPTKWVCTECCKSESEIVSYVKGKTKMIKNN